VFGGKNFKPQKTNVLFSVINRRNYQLYGTGM
jgi:hypothetical protein